jgi:hypothetical protein
MSRLHFASATLVLTGTVVGLSLSGAIAVAGVPPDPPTLLGSGPVVSRVHEFTGLPLTPDGWTDLDAIIQSPGYSDSRIMYVSASDGNNLTGQIYTQAQVNALGGTPTNPMGSVNAFATIAAARNNMRAGYPDVLLLKRGDAWAEALVPNLNLVRGRAQTQRAIFSAYGASGSLPNVQGRLIQAASHAPASNTIVAHIDNYNPLNDPGSPSWSGDKVANVDGVSVVKGGEDNLVEGVRFRFGGVAWQAWNPSPEPRGEVVNLAFRRNTFKEAYPSQGGGHQQGLWASDTNGFLIEENIFDHNGWIDRDGHSAGPTIFNHNMYLAQGGVTDGIIVRNNILANASSYSLQGRPGGVYVNNLMLREPMGAYIADKGGVLSYNVMLDSATRTSGGSGWGLMDRSTGSVLVENNVIANKAPGVGQWAWALNVTNFNLTNPDFRGPEGYAGPKEAVIRGNVIYHWFGDGILISSGGTMPTWGDFGSLVFENNRIVAHPSANQRFLISVTSADAYNKAIFSGNQYYSSNSTPFNRLGSWISHAQWVAQTGETGSAFGPISFPDPTRSIASYMHSIGFVGDVDEFLAVATAMHRWNWDGRFTASAVNSYIREGFGVPDP